MNDLSGLGDEPEASPPAEQSRPAIPGRVLCSILLLLLMGSIARSQQSAFGLLSTYPLPGSVQSSILAQDPLGTDSLLVLWSRGSRMIHLVHIAPSRDALEISTRILPDSVTALAVMDVDGNGRADLACVAAGKPVFFAVTSLDTDTLTAVNALPLSFRPTGLLLAGTGGHGNRVLLYGMEFPGLIPVIGPGGKKPRLGKTVVPDVSARFVEETQLNDDGLLDLAVVDWIHNAIHLLYGVGGGRYLDESTFPVRGEIRGFRMTSSEQTGEPGFVVLTTNPDQVQIWQGDGLGDFKLQSSCALGHAASSMSVADINNDGWEDVLLTDERGMVRVIMNTGEETLDDVTEYAAGRMPVSIVAVGNTGGHAGALALDDAGKTMYWYHNAAERRLLTDSLQYACGLQPASLMIGRVRPEDPMDIVVACERSKTLEFYFGSGKGLSGPSSVSLAFSPHSLGFHSRNDSLARFIVTSPSEQSISFLSYNTRTQSHTVATIPGVGVLEPLASGLSDSSIQYYCFGAPGEAETPSLTFFQQLGGSRFIERSFRLTIPDALIGAAVADVNSDGMMDAAYVYRSNLSGRYELVVMEGDSAGEFSKRAFTMELPDTVIQKSYLYFHDFNQDSIPDLLICFPRGAYKAKIAVGTRDGFTLAGELDGAIRAVSRDEIQILDVDGDGVADIAANDAEKNAVGYWKGKGDGSFLGWKPLLQRSGISHFAMADMNGDGIPDLAVTLEQDGVLKLYDGRLILKP